MRWSRLLGVAALALALPLGAGAQGAAKPDAQKAAAARRAQQAKKAKAKKPASYPGVVRERTANSPTWAIQAGDVVDVNSPSAENLAALRRGIEDLSKSFPGQYARGAEFLKRLGEIEKAAAANPADPKAAEAFHALRAEAMLANPLLDFGKILLVKRKEGKLGLPQNWQGNCALPRNGYENEIATLDLNNLAAGPKTLYRPAKDAFVGDVDLHFDAGKMLFSSLDDKGRWQIFEVKADGSGLRQITNSDEEPAVDNYDPCYLPSGKILFDSTRCFQGVPCVTGSNTVANLCVMDNDGKNQRMLCFDQDHDWCPTVMPNGRILYTRWEYSDTAHYFTRLLFQMNPDGTGQRAFSHSNTYWPNTTLYARPVPGSATKVVAVASGHHGVTRMGELIIFDAAKGRSEAEGVVQRIPGYGKPVEPVIADQLVQKSWPKFLHPYPLSDKYFLVSMKADERSPWGLYLVDTFDNMTPIYQEQGYAMFEPLPFRKSVTPPVIPDQVDLAQKDATVYIQDIYKGEGLKGVPRGSVKNLRLYEFYYTYPKMGGHKDVGVEGPWDVRRILGTVPVNADGSAVFKAPANTPIAIQPLDEKGRAMQIMRSWFTAMPGEKLSCVGCHERENSAPPTQAAKAMYQTPETIKPWHGPARGFSFTRDVQPVLDQYCVGCHNGSKSDRPDFSRKEKNGWLNFEPSYLALHPYVRRPGPESDDHMYEAMEWHTSTSELVQMLEKGHHGVKLDAEAWDRLNTWIDLNVPSKGTWGEHKAITDNFKERRIAMLSKYAGRSEDPEVIPELPKKDVSFVKPQQAPRPEVSVQKPAGWPMTAEQAAALQKAAGAQTRRTVDLGGGVTMEMVLIPAGEFVMGSGQGALDEAPICRVKIEQPFWMSVTEVTNLQYQRFDPAHDSRYIDMQHKDHTTPGYPANEPSQPVIRISWNEAAQFCNWLSKKSGQSVTLPSEAQWEWACRAGAETPFAYGDLSADFGKFANLADQSIKLLAVSGINPQPIANPSPYEDWTPKDARFNDGAKVVSAVGQYQANAWGLQDMHGNVAEWTRSLYKPYPYNAADGREDAKASGPRVARGGSWMDRPYRATASFRLAYEAWQPVHNVGFRVIIPVGESAKLVAKQ